MFALALLALFAAVLLGALKWDLARMNAEMAQSAAVNHMRMHVSLSTYHTGLAFGSPRERMTVPANSALMARIQGAHMAREISSALVRGRMA